MLFKGVEQIIVVVIKMDMTNPPWSEERFITIEAIMRELLLSLHCKAQDVQVVPVSGLMG